MSYVNAAIPNRTWYSRFLSYDSTEAERWNFEMSCDPQTMRTIRYNYGKAKLYKCLNWKKASIDCKIDANFSSQPGAQVQRVTGWIEFKGTRTGRWARAVLALYLPGGHQNLFSIWVWPTGMPQNKPQFTTAISRKRIWHYYSGV